MRSKLLIGVAAVVVIAVVVFLVLRNGHSKYTEEDVAQIHSLVGRIDSGYNALNSTDPTIFRSLLSPKKDSAKLDRKVLLEMFEKRSPQLTALRKQLDSLERMERDSTSPLTKALDSYLKMTRGCLAQIEQQASASIVLLDPNAPNMNPPPAVPLPDTIGAAAAGLPTVVTPMAMPLVQNLQALARINADRQKADAAVMQATH